MKQNKDSTDDWDQCQFGVVGLGAMGANFALNVAEKGLRVIGVDPDADRVGAFCNAGSTYGVQGTTSLQKFVESLATPRKIFLLVPAGNTVDALIEELVPLMQPADILLDGGNSFFGDTDRRIDRLDSTGVAYMGVGVSGGAEGARHGASIMPGGSADTYEIVRPVFESVAARADGVPCVDFIGQGSAGHYVKMVHNGIEYALMQLISESYDVLKRLGGLNNEQLADTFDAWNDGVLSSFLIEITSKIFRQKDSLGDGDLIDVIKDKAKQKGTGQWTSQNALALGVPVPTIHAAVVMRSISSFESQRHLANKILGKTEQPKWPKEKTEALINDTRDALLFGYILCYDQGLRLIAAASKEYDYGIRLETCARIWKGGCIIRATMLEDIRNAYLENPQLESLMFSEPLSKELAQLQDACRRTVKLGTCHGVPVSGLAASLAYFDAFRADGLPLNLVQAQRDFFGMHSFERMDREGSFHIKASSGNQQA